jgi:hypothetical protein
MSVSSSGRVCGTGPRWSMGAVGVGRWASGDFDPRRSLARFTRRLPSAGSRRIVCAGYPATTGRHTLQGLKPAFVAASAERKRRRFSGFILLALRQVVWQKIPVVGVAR